MIKITDGLYKGIEKAHGDMPMMCLDDLTEMFGIEQFDYMLFDMATTVPQGIRTRDEKGHSVRV